MLIFSTSFVAEKINMVKRHRFPYPDFGAFLAMPTAAVIPSARPFPPMRPRATGAFLPSSMVMASTSPVAIFADHDSVADWRLDASRLWAPSVRHDGAA